jgi:HK97 gp10 family phage protein
MSKVISLTGDKQLDRLFRDLPKSLTSKVVTSALKDSAKPMVRAAKSNIDSVKTGNLKRSIGTVTDKSKDYKGSIRVGARMKKGSKNMLGFHAHFIEFGTAPRKPKTGKTLKFEGSGGLTVYPKSVKGVVAKPFMRPAYNSTKGNVTKEFGEIAGNKLLMKMNRVISKNGK